MPQARRNSEKINESKQINDIKNHFGDGKVAVKKTGIYPTYYVNGKRIYVNNLLLYIYENKDKDYNIDIKFRKTPKQDFSYIDGNGEILIECKENTNVFCETLCVSKTRTGFNRFCNICESKGYVPVEVQNTALMRFFDKYGEKYLEIIKQENLLPDYILDTGSLYKMEDVELVPHIEKYYSKNIKERFGNDGFDYRFQIIFKSN